MADIVHDFFIKTTPLQVFNGVATPQGLDKWWTKTSSGQPVLGSEYDLGFGPEYQWKALVTKCTSEKEFEFVMTQAEADWKGSKVGFRIKQVNEGSQVQFYHTGWPVANEHYRISCYCWAMYLRLLKINLERDLMVEYELRLEV